MPTGVDYCRGEATSNLLGRLLHGAVVVEGGELLLDALSRVGELALAQLQDRLLDPLEQV